VCHLIFGLSMNLQLYDTSCQRNLVKLFADAFCLLFITFLTIFKPIICFFETKLTIISMDDYDKSLHN
jgi:hypothetical protein